MPVERNRTRGILLQKTAQLASNTARVQHCSCRREDAHGRSDCLSLLPVVERSIDTPPARSARVRVRGVPSQLAGGAGRTTGADRRVSDGGGPREAPRRKRVSAPECVILVGLPGAGKSTFFRARFPTHTHVSKDAFPPHARDKQSRQDAAIRSAHAEGKRPC